MDYKTIKVIKSEKAEADVIEIKEERLTKIDRNIIIERINGDLINQAYYLNDDYDWIIGKDNEGILVLVPLKKE